MFFGQDARGILARSPGIKPVSSASEGKVLTTGIPGKFHTLDISNRQKMTTFHSQLNNI